MHQYISINNLANLQGKFSHWGQFAKTKVDLLSALFSKYKIFINKTKHHYIYYIHSIGIGIFNSMASI